MSDPTSDLERLRALMLEHLHVDVPSPDVDLLESGVLDSLQLVDLLLLIEQHFGRRISIEAIDLDDLRSLERLARLLHAPAATAASVPPAGEGTIEHTPRPGDLPAARHDRARRRG